MNRHSKTILNLGCGTKTSDSEGVVNIDWSIYLRFKKSRVGRAVAPLVFRGERLRRFKALGRNVKVHDLRGGIPYPDDSVDVVYHSHILEHLDRCDALGFLREAKRVLKPGGTLRVVVPDFEVACRRYIQSVDACSAGEVEPAQHEEQIAAILDQSVRREAYGSSIQPPARRWLENRVLGDARARGETHQWMYDRMSLASRLRDLGFSATHQMEFNTSNIPEWGKIGLDAKADGSVYKEDSLYIEAVK